jgi:hypothetical protein
MRERVAMRKRKRKVEEGNWWTLFYFCFLLFSKTWKMKLDKNDKMTCRLLCNWQLDLRLKNTRPTPSPKCQPHSLF